MTDGAERQVSLSAGDRVGNLLLERELARGGFGAVFLARDQVIGRAVALKALLPAAAAPTDEERESFLAEARVIAGIPSPYIVTLFAVHDRGEEGWLIEMEYVDGGSLHEVIQAGERISAQRAMPIVRALLEALRAAHEHGVLHRDIKPGNVLMGRDGSVKLADFGLALVTSELPPPGTPSGAIVGTPWYMAPELFLGADASPQTDLWAAGVVIHEMLMGTPPFNHSNLPALIRAIRNEAPPPLRPEVEPTFGRIVAQCLAKRPAERAKSAAEVLASLDRVTRRVSVAGVAAVGSGRLFGRTADVRRILALMNAASSGQSVLLWIEGAAGAGKSALLEEMRLAARPFGFVWLDVALTGLSGLTRPLLAAARAALAPGGGDEELEDALVSGDFGRALPILRVMLGLAVDLKLQDREQAVWALGLLLRGLAADGTLCIAVEDVHMLGEDDLWLLRELAQGIAGTDALLMLTSRPQATHPVGRPEGLDVVERMHLGGLPSEVLYRLLEDRAQGLTIQPRIAESIARRSDGNALLALELFRHLRAEEAIAATDDAWEITDAWGTVTLPDGLRDVFAQRLDALDDDDRELLEAAAVDGVTFDGETLAAVLDISPLKILRRLQRLCRKGGLLVAEDDAYRFAHPMLRDVLYDETAPELRRFLHAALAEHLEQREGRVNAERLGTHWEQAGDVERARPYLVKAAALAALRLERRRALELIERSRVLEDRPDLDLLARHGAEMVQIAALYRDMDRTDDAEALLASVRSAAEHADDAALAARVDVQSVLTHHDAGRLTEADSDTLRRVVASLAPCRELGLAHHCLAMLARRAGNLDEAQRELTLADEMFVSLGLEHLHATEANALGSVAARRGDFDRAEALYAEAAETSERLGRHVNAAISQVNRVNAAVAIGRLEGRRGILERAIRTIELEGQKATAAQASAYLANLAYALGDLEGAVEVAERAVDRSRPLDAPVALATSLLTAAPLVAAVGRLERARALVDDAGEIVESLHDETLLAHTVAADAKLAAFMGDPAGAARMALDALNVNADGGNSPDALAVEMLSLAVLGVGRLVWDRALELLAAATDLDPRVREFVGSGLRGALAFADPAGDPADLWAAADALTAETVGDLRAELRVVAQWMRAECHRRRGDNGEAAREGTAASSAASLLGHVWLEAAVLLYLDGIEPSSVRRDRRKTLVRRVTQSIASAEIRAAIGDAWSP